MTGTAGDLLDQGTASQGPASQRPGKQGAGKQEASAPGDRGPGGGKPLERVTVNLTARSSAALDEASALSGDTKTDIVNRALQVYAFLERIHDSGGSVHVRESPDAELERIKFF